MQKLFPYDKKDISDVHSVYFTLQCLITLYCGGQNMWRKSSRAILEAGPPQEKIKKKKKLLWSTHAVQMTENYGTENLISLMTELILVSFTASFSCTYCEGWPKAPKLYLKFREF